MVPCPLVQRPRLLGFQAYTAPSFSGRKHLIIQHCAFRNVHMFSVPHVRAKQCCYATPLLLEGNLGDLRRLPRNCLTVVLHRASRPLMRNVLCLSIKFYQTGQIMRLLPGCCKLLQAAASCCYCYYHYYHRSNSYSSMLPLFSSLLQCDVVSSSLLKNRRSSQKHCRNRH